MKMNTEKFLEDLKTKCVSIINENELKELLNSGKKLTIKFGADPSRPDLHLGHSVVMRALKGFQDLGHKVVFIIGDYTAMIGDPSGKSATRPSLTHEQARKSGESYFEQVGKILDRDKIEIRYNSEWLSKLTFKEILELMGKYTVAQILERDDFAKRYHEKTPIGMHEFLYPLMQGYDSVAIDADIEIGGTDQTFNLLVGRYLKPKFGLSTQQIITFPLLAGLDGKNKMSKSLDNYIGVSEESDVMFEKCMKVPDELLKQYFVFTTNVTAQEAEKLIATDVREAHFEFAKIITTTYHNAESAAAAKERYLTVAKGALPKNIDVVKFDCEEVPVVNVLVSAGFAGSKSVARKLVQGGGVKVDGEKITDFNFAVQTKNQSVVSKGKACFVRVVFENN